MASFTVLLLGFFILSHHISFQDSIKLQTFVLMDLFIARLRCFRYLLVKTQTRFKIPNSKTWLIFRYIYIYTYI